MNANVNTDTDDQSRPIAIVNGDGQALYHSNQPTNVQVQELVNSIASTIANSQDPQLQAVIDRNALSSSVDLLRHPIAENVTSNPESPTNQALLAIAIKMNQLEDLLQRDQTDMRQQFIQENQTFMERRHDQVLEWTRNYYEHLGNQHEQLLVDLHKGYTERLNDLTSGTRTRLAEMNNQLEEINNQILATRNLMDKQAAERQQDINENRTRTTALLGALEENLEMGQTLAVSLQQRQADAANLIRQMSTLRDEATQVRENETQAFIGAIQRSIVQPLRESVERNSSLSDTMVENITALTAQVATITTALSQSQDTLTGLTPHAILNRVQPMLENFLQHAAGLLQTNHEQHDQRTAV